MIKIYNVNRELVKATSKYNNLQIQKEVNQLDKLRFNTNEDIGSYIDLEGYVETKQGFFVIKEVDLYNSYNIVAEMDLEDLNSLTTLDILKTMSLQEMIEELIKDTDWVLKFEIESNKKTISVEDLDILSAIIKCVNLFKYEVKFDNVSKELEISNEIGRDRGTYFHENLNLKGVSMGGDTYDFATRLIPKGKDGLGISEVNNGVPYLENYSHSSKVVTKVWEDNRYTVAENLKNDAMIILDKLSKPVRHLECTVADLSKHSGYEFLDFDVGDYITIVSKSKGLREKQRIISIIFFPDNVEDNIVTIENKPRDLSDRFEEQDEIMKEQDEIIKEQDDRIKEQGDRIKEIEDLLGLGDDDGWPGGGFNPVYEKVEDMVKKYPSLKIGLSSWIDVNEEDTVRLTASGKVMEVMYVLTKKPVYNQSIPSLAPTLKNRDGRRWLSFNPDPMTLNRWSGSKEDRPSSSIQQHGEYMLHLNSGHSIKSIFIIYYDRTPEPLDNYKSGSAARFFRAGTSSPLGHPFSNLHQTRSRPNAIIVPIITDYSFVAENVINGFNTGFGDSDRLVRPVSRHREKTVAVHRNIKIGESINLANIGMNKENYDDYVASNITASHGGSRGDFYEMNAFFTGEIAEIILHTRELDANEVATLKEYARMKYSL